MDTSTSTTSQPMPDITTVEGRAEYMDRQFESVADIIAQSLERIAAEVRAEAASTTKAGRSRTQGAAEIIRTIHGVLPNLPITSLLSAASAADTSSTSRIAANVERGKFESFWRDGRESIARDVMKPADDAGQKEPSLFPGETRFD